jgi:RimJ/RimL family protein N-acetyltransferase
VSVMKTFPVFTSLLTARLLLKDLTVADAEALFRYRSLPEITRFQGFAPLSVEDALGFIEKDICHEVNQPDTWFQFGIFHREEQTLIGDLGIHFFAGENTAEIGVTIAPQFQGRGYASEAVGCVIDFIFETLHKDKVIASVDPKNHKSMALMRRVGFQLEGINKNAVLFRGEWVDDAVFEITPQQWRSRA